MLSLPLQQFRLSRGQESCIEEQNSVIFILKCSGAGYGQLRIL